ncbi:AzlD domain-containing protein [Phaeovulum vinaykumarii]|uniref:Branched-chain amino acid transport protein n=1 Tax=Phaeovulum vinaykumarii TaxID=407234 RepID=A0A1N7K9T6_9RHOB|nr:AzlD domain-containing protein [Phaeovulum vinaykumarii]SIS58356.1 Branched-chain amino acid transport protein [Phaeovulum vinaykumarii]SOB93762.1 branched-subunit amino acid transport protein [Phaeovulum vinaykumarii]
MTSYTPTDIWTVIVLLGLGTFGLRFSFLGALGRRPLPDWALRHLRYTAVAIMPGLVAPLVLWPAATGGQTDPARLLAALAAIVCGMATRNTLVAILGGLAALYLGLFSFG